LTGFYLPICLPIGSRQPPKTRYDRCFGLSGQVIRIAPRSEKQKKLFIIQTVN